MARLHSGLGERTVYTVAGLAKAQGMACTIYANAAGTVTADLAEYNPEDVDTPGAAITGGALVVDAYSNRPAFWDLDNLEVLYITVNGGPLEPIYPDPQPQIADLVAAVATLDADSSAAVADEAEARADADAALAEDIVAAQAAATTAGIGAAAGLAIVFGGI